MSAQIKLKHGPQVYLAGPIAADPDGAAHWRRKATAHLVEEDASVFNPRAAFAVPENRLLDERYIDPIQVINDVAIAQSSVVLVHVATDVISKGTEHEMRMCAELDVNVVLWVPWLVAYQAYSTQEGYCHYIDDPYADYGTELRVVFTARNLSEACREAARHARIIGLA
jgi:hypothetical protein